VSAIPAGIWCVLAGAAPEELPALGVAALAAGAAALTLRQPAGAACAVVAAWRAPALAHAWRAVHAHADWAAASDSQAVIAGARSLPVAALRRSFPSLCVGASVHDRDEAGRARDDGAAFLLFGPVWATPAKAGVLAPRGLDALADCCALGLPVIAIGGVLTPAQVREARAAGAHACAVLRAARDLPRLAQLTQAGTAADDQRGAGSGHSNG
jgi:thiamine monophosphate synthase